MNLSASQCISSGCESGWTSYLDQSSLSKNHCSSFGGEEYAGRGARVGNEETAAEEDDLSMVSDASSGPRHYCEDDEDCFDVNGCFYSPHLAFKLAQKSKKKKTKEHVRNQQHNSYLDDTASSPVLGISKKNISFSKNEDLVEHVLDFSQGFSATHIQKKSTMNKHFDFLQSSQAGKPSSGKKGGFKGGERER